MNPLLRKRIIFTAGKVLYNLFRYLLLIGIAYIALFPLIRLISASLTPPEEMLGNGGMTETNFVPNDPTFQNYTYGLSYFSYMKHAGATLYIALLSTFFTCITCSLAGYGLGRYAFKGRALVFGAMLMMIVVPLYTAQIPLYYDMRWFDFFGIGKIVGWFTGKPLTVNLLKNYLNYFVPALFGAGLSSGIFIFLFMQFFSGMPRDLEDAAKLDGCGPWKIYLKVMLPNITPVLATVALLSMVYYWNDSFICSMSTNVTNAPLMMALDLLTSSGAIGDFGNADTASRICANWAILVLSMAPLTVIFIFCQKFFVESMDRSGIKG
ncbi:MAG: carbohydrate ABC transporter permease [Oscillospiraceae bacterium]|nr:carbohydrate ABC transporter permease [Oscillospiraceae bacterium]